MEEISLNRIIAGMRAGVVRLVMDPNMGSGTVCQIGDIWFYFGGMTAEEESPSDYLQHVPEEGIAREICEALDGIRSLDNDEYLYYYYFLKESGI